jgi:hypothetical protein
LQSTFNVVNMATMGDEMENRRIRIVSEFLYFLLTGRHQRIFSTR